MFVKLLKYLYKYPQAKFPYQQLVEESQRRSIDQPEFELLDTGVFDDDRYFDVFVEYAKADPEDICIRVEVFNRGRQPATLHVLPQLWFRNTWSWTDIPGPTPTIQNAQDPSGQACLIADDSAANPLANLLTDYALGERYLYAQSGAKPLFTNNETHHARLDGCPDWTPFVKDAFHRYVIKGESCVNPDESGTKACLHYENVAISAGESVVIRLRLTDRPIPEAIQGVDAVVQQRRSETDAFYDELHPPRASPDERLVQRQALAGMIWSKQFYYFDVNRLFHEYFNAETGEGLGANHQTGWTGLVATLIDEWRR